MKVRYCNLIYFQHIMFLLLNDNKLDNRVYRVQIDYKPMHDLVLEFSPSMITKVDYEMFSREIL